MKICVYVLAALIAGCSANASVEAGAPTRSAVPVLRQPMAQSEDLPGETVETVSHAQTSAERLAKAIDTYRALAAGGGWPVIPSAKSSLKPGALDSRVPVLRARLALTDGAPEVAEVPEIYDAALEAAVRRFQARHGLEADGIVGRGTIDDMNVPVETRIAALERTSAAIAVQETTWGDRYIAINVPEAVYRYVDGETALTGPAIVGQPTWQTPVLDSVIDRIDLNPSWTVPPRIASREIWPKVQKDPEYLRKHGMTITAGGKVYQAPGAGNPLGQVKFSFDNPYAVYLHDTNRKDLFEKAIRYLSHGCVRVSDPLKLATNLILQNTDWTEAKIEDALKRKGTTRIPLERPIPVHIVYNTAWVSEDGTIHLRPDVYKLEATRTTSAGQQNLDVD